MTERSNDGCVFCDRDLFNDRIIAETDNFYVIVGIGIVAPGHVMIVTKKHYKCFGELPDKLEEEFQELKSRLIGKMIKEFSEPFLVEYGNWNQSINHAHIHIIPKEASEYRVHDIIEEMVKPGFDDYEETIWDELKSIFIKEGAYVFIQDNGKIHVCHVKNIPDTQEPYPHLGFRWFFAEKGMKGVWTWMNMTDEEKRIDAEKIRITIAKLKNRI